MFIEYRIDKGEWQADPHHTAYEDEYIRSVTATGRNYALFAALAGVRGKGPAPRDLPDDVSVVVKKASDMWGCDGHSHSWISLKEFAKLIGGNKGWHRFGIKTHPKSKDAFFEWDDYSYDGKDKPMRPNCWSTIVNYCNDIEENIDHILIDRHILGQNHKVDVRLVYWFDN